MSYEPPKRATAFIAYVGLFSQATGLLQVNPTIAAGDFKVSIDGGAFANLTTLPVVTPAGGRAVKIALSEAEMTGDNIVVTAVDAAGAEWCDVLLNIPTSVYQTDDIFSTAVADSIPALGSRPSIAQAAYLVTQFLTNRAVDDVTLTIAKPDGTTALLTCTINDAENITSTTRAT